ncbi:hypothetical protein D3C75_474520 [compost metagenome]
MNAPHPHREAHLIIPVLTDALPPVFQQNLPVAARDGIIVFGICIALAFKPRGPLILVAAQQHVTVRGTDNNAHPLSQRTVLGIAVEIIDMHRRPDIVRLQAEQQLEDMAVGYRSDGAVRCMQSGPVIQLLFIIQENAAVLHRRPVGLTESCRHTIRALGLHRNIRPVMPRGYANCLTQVVDTEDRTPAVRTNNVQYAVHSLLKKSFPAPRSRLILNQFKWELGILQGCWKLRALFQCSNNDGAFMDLCRKDCLTAEDPLNVGNQIRCGDLYSTVFLFGHIDMYRLAACEQLQAFVSWVDCIQVH